MKELQITEATLDQVIRSPQVRAALRAQGRILLPRAQRVAAQANAPLLGKALRMVDGTRPGTKSPTGLRRPYVRVTADLTDPILKEARQAKLSPQKIMRRAAS